MGIGQKRFGNTRLSVLLLAALNQGSGVASSLVAMVLLTHLVDPETYGGYVVLLTVSLLGTQATHAGWFQFAMRGWSRAEHRQRAWVEFLARAGLARIPALAGLVLACFAGWRLVGDAGMSWWCVPGLLVVALGWVMHSAVVVMFNAADRHRGVMLLGWWSGAWRAILPALAVWWLGVRVELLLAGMALAAALSIGGGLFAWWRAFGASWRVAGEVGADWRPELRRYDWAYPVLGLAAWLAEGCDRWLIVQREPALGGQFALVFSLGLMLFSLATSGLHQVWLPGLYRQLSGPLTEAVCREAVRLCDRLLLAYLALGALGLAVLGVMGPWLVDFGLIGGSYRDAWSWLWFAGLAAAYPRLLQFHGLLFQGLGQPQAVLGLSWGLTLTKLVLSAAALAWSVTAFLWALPLATLVAAVVGRIILVRRFHAMTRKAASVAPVTSMAPGAP